MKIKALLGALLVLLSTNVFAASATISNGSSSCVYNTIALDSSGNLTVTCKGQVVAETCPQMVTRLYLEVFGKGPDAGGLAFWADQCVNGMTETQMRATLRTYLPVVGVPSAIVPDWPVNEPLGRDPPFNVHICGTVHAYRVQRSQTGRAISQFTQGQTPNSATKVTEMQVSQVPGVIDTNAHVFSTTFNNFVVVEVFDRDPPASLGEAQFYAPSTAAGDWYVNVRWTCISGHTQSGHSMQWGEGAR
jgi:hypothetical protein